MITFGTGPRAAKIFRRVHDIVSAGSGAAEFQELTGD
jgi:hypothetical protein